MAVSKFSTFQFLEMKKIISSDEKITKRQKGRDLVSAWQSYISKKSRHHNEVIKIHIQCLLQVLKMMSSIYQNSQQLSGWLKNECRANNYVWNL